LGPRRVLAAMVRFVTVGETEDIMVIETAGELDHDGCDMMVIKDGIGI